MVEESKEDQLLKELIAGDEKAFEILYDIYFERIYAYCISLLKSEFYAEEIVQDTFVAVWAKREKLNISLSFKSYLYAIARNKSFDFLRKAARDIELRKEVFYLSQKSYKWEDENIREEQIEVIAALAINELPPKRRRIFYMSRNEGKSYADISEELGISIQTVKGQMRKALATIRHFLLIHKDIVVMLMILISAWKK